MRFYYDLPPPPSAEALSRIVNVLKSAGGRSEAKRSEQKSVAAASEVVGSFEGGGGLNLDAAAVRTVVKEAVVEEFKKMEGLLLAQLKEAQVVNERLQRELLAALANKGGGGEIVARFGDERGQRKSKACCIL